VTRAALAALVLLLVAGGAACQREMVLSPYGTLAGVSRSDGGAVLKRAFPHHGVDFRVDRNGGPALAAADGVVTKAFFEKDTGYIVVVRHPGSGYWTRYVHLETVLVHEGEAVRRGQELGNAGIFVNSAGVRHVHLELCSSATCWGPGPMGSTEDPLSHMHGCFVPGRAYGGSGLVLTYPVRC
jgi:hypothetical protein